MEWLNHLILDFLLVLSLGSLIFTLPGVWIMVFLMAIWVFIPGTSFTWDLVLVALVAAVIAEILEFMSSIVGVKKTGGSKAASWGALLGGVIGTILGTLFILIPVVGTFMGLFLGTFIGAFVMEMKANRDGARKVAVGATIARAAGLMVKFIAGIGILFLVVADQFKLFD